MNDSHAKEILFGLKLPQRESLISRGDVPVDLFDSISYELRSLPPVISDEFGCIHLDPNIVQSLRVWLSIKNFLAHRLTKEELEKLTK